MGQGGGFLKVLIDSSVWIPFLRGHSELPNEVSVAMSEGVAHLCPVVWVAIFRGVRGKREERIAKELSALCPSLPMDDQAWEEAARLGLVATQSGLNCPLTDVLIVACAKRHEATLMHNDKHFEALEKL